MNPYITYPDMRTKNSIEKILELGHQTDHISPKKFQLLLENSADPENAKFSLIFIRRKETELISVGFKLIEAKVI